VSSPLLEVQGLVRHFGGVKALDGVDVGVWEGEVLGLVGPNGSGKSTLINVVSGQIPPTAGRIHLAGRDITGSPPHRISRLGLARTFQRPRPFSQLTVEENVLMGSAFGGSGSEDPRAVAREILDFVGLAEYASEPVTRLNLHQLKFLELARALATRPKILLLDEVLSGLNPTEVDESVEMIGKINQRGTTLVVVEHIMRVVVKLCNRVVVLDGGRLIAEGPPREVMADPEVRRAYLGTRSE
jgi:branched-chain amino acid transport system permease protein